MKTISIIIPCYNCENTIECLISSLNSQSLKDFEAIFIEDKSKDDTLSRLRLCLNASNFDYKILVNESNRGPGEARNAGIEHSQGEYLMFMDSDDRLACTAIENLSNIVNCFNKPDAVLFDYYSCAKGKNILRNTMKCIREGWVDKDSAILYSSSSPWCKMYKTQVIRKNGIGFPNMRAKEDFAFNKVALSYCNNVYYLKKHLYYYEYNHTSIMNTIKLKGASTASLAFEFIKEKCYEDCRKTVKLLSIQEYLFASLQSMVRMKCKIKELRKVLLSYEDCYPEWSKDYKKLVLGKDVKIGLFLLKYKLFTLFICEVRIKDFLKKIC